MIPTTQPTVVKQIFYIPHTDTYAALIAIDDAPFQQVGSAPTYDAADQLCKDYIYDHYAEHTPEVAARIAIAQAEIATAAIAEACPSCGELLRACEAINTWLGTDDGCRAFPFEPPWYQEFRNAITRAHRYPTRRQDGDRPAAKVNWSESPAARLIPAAELAQLAKNDPNAFRARLAALSDSDLEWQAALYAAYATLMTGKHVTTEEILEHFRRSIAVHQARATPDGDICAELALRALTDPLALAELLRAYTEQQRQQLAWQFAAWLQQRYGITCEPSFLLRGWDALLISASASGMPQGVWQAEIDRLN